MGLDMATRPLRREDWAPVQPTKISTRSAREPRDEQLRIPGKPQRSRPKPIFGSHQPDALPNVPPESFVFSEDICDSPRDPEVVDLAAPNTWPIRGASKPRPYSKRKACPSLASQCSTRHSEMSFGILNYYLDDPSPLHCPELPPPTPKVEPATIDPAIEKFDFGLNTDSPTARMHDQDTFKKIIPDTEAGAEIDLGSDEAAPTPEPIKLQAEPRSTYRLFPTVKDTTTPSKTSSTSDQHTCTPASNITWVPSHQQPDPSYRPRKESLSGSVRSRKDSFNSFCGTRRIPLRILSGSTTNSNTRNSGSNSTSTASPPERSRWSDDTITSPVAATTSGPRTSFGSLLGRDSAQYPACFFEDDDEAAPLRRKFGWRRSGSSAQEQRARRAGRYDERSDFGRRVVSALLCGACCGGHWLDACPKTLAG